MSLSRKYRPQTFGDITGQEGIKETLRKEVETGKIGHAYLFSGPRGVGKTTSARILAKALNCEKPKKGEPCNACAACTQANEGRALDVIEMDAASNTGVDNVREAIIEHVRFAPVSSTYKVYVVDEAHMLSTSAWNALLKTLEEPPAYAVFILATTELHKVPATIVSRCQRFDFKRIPEEALKARVIHLAHEEGIKIDDAVAVSVARHADGCVRDAETLLDQLLSLGEKKITSDIAELVIPASRLPLAAELLDVCASRSLKDALRKVEAIDEQGIPLVPLFDDVIRAIRLLLLAADDPSVTKKLETGDEGEKKLASVVGRFTAAELSEMALLFMERRRDAKQGIDPRFALELAVTAISVGVLPHGPGATFRETTNVKHVPADLGVKVTEVQVPKPSKTSEKALELNLIRAKWSLFVNRVGEQNRSLSFILSTSRPEAVDGSCVTIRFQYPFHRDKIMNDPKTQRTVEAALAEVIGAEDVRVEAIVGEDETRKEARSQDMVSNVLRAFGGQVVDEAADAS